MGGVYMNKFTIVEHLSNKIKHTDKQKELITAIEEAREELQRARNYFEQVNDPQLVDYAIYMEQAAKARFTYLINQAKENGIRVSNRFEQWETDVV
jgi:hypothetical protein